MKARSAKAKGSRLERNFSQWIREIGLDEHARRMPLSGAISGLREDIYTKLPIHFELKNRETWQPLQWYKDNETKTGTKMVVIVMAKNHEQPYAFLAANDFLELLKYACDAGWTYRRTRFTKPERTKKLSVEETDWQAFSKKKQLHKNVDS